MGKWSKFDKQVERCEISFLMEPEELDNQWRRSFELFSSIWENEKRNRYSDRKISLKQLEDDTDWEHGFLQWLEDCIDELSMVEDYEFVLGILNYMQKEFLWEDFDTEYGSYVVECLRELGDILQAEAYCKKMLKRKPDNYFAIASLARVYMKTSAYEDAEHLLLDTKELEGDCNDTNFVLFLTIKDLYAKTKQKKKEKQIQKKLDAYDTMAEEELEFDEEDFYDDDDWELPFS